jgi:hypothetical protein
LNRRIDRSQTTTMKIRNKSGRIHAAFNAFDIVPDALGPDILGSATLHSL